mgnify:CR=1 FL=1
MACELKPSDGKEWNKQFRHFLRTSLLCFEGFPKGLKPFIYAIVPDNDPIFLSTILPCLFFQKI